VINSYCIVLADDDVLFRPLLKRLLSGEPGFEVAGDVGDGLELLALLGGLRAAPQMAVLDITMPNLGGIDTASRIKAAYPELKILIVSIHREPEYVRKAVSAGANGYILKEDVENELFPAIQKIRSGEAYFSLRLVAEDLSEY
jgi:DNA-binding NarL/FixJ family response regulator